MIRARAGKPVRARGKGLLNQKIKREFDPGSESTLAARLTHASRTRKPGQPGEYSGVRVSNTWMIYLLVGDNPGKPGLIPHKPAKGKPEGAGRGVRGRLASWWGKGSPRRRSVAGLRGHTATLALGYGPDSYGRQQWGILHNGGNSDAATPRER